MFVQIAAQFAPAKQIKEEQNLTFPNYVLLGDTYLYHKEVWKRKIDC